MNPVILIILAPIGLLFATVVYFGGNEDEAARALARSRPAPAAVEIEKFDPKRDRGPTGEVVLLGQVDVSQRVDFSRLKNEDVKDRYALAPIYPVSAQSTDEAARGLLIRRGRLSKAELDSYVVGEGAIGPVMRLDGQLLKDYEARPALEAGFKGQVKITRPAVYLDPYEKGRDAALAPSTSARDAAIFVAAFSLLIGLIGAIWQWRRVKADRDETDGYYGERY